MMTLSSGWLNPGLKPSHQDALSAPSLAFVSPSVLLALLPPIIVGLPLMPVKKRTLESSNLTLKHKQEVSRK